MVLESSERQIDTQQVFEKQSIGQHILQEMQSTLPQQAEFSAKADSVMTAFPVADLLLSRIADTKGSEQPSIKFPLTVMHNPLAGYRDSQGHETRRAKMLDIIAGEFLAENARSDNSLSLPQHGHIMREIASNRSFSEADKFYLYKQVCDKERAGRSGPMDTLIPNTHNYRVKFELAPPHGLPESLKGDVVRHIIIDPTNDGYHGSLVYGEPPAPALWQRGRYGAIIHEALKKRMSGHLDVGDLEASFRQIDCLEAMQKGGFNAYAEAWNKNFSK